MTDENRKYKYGCIMANFSIRNWDEIIGMIDKEDIYNEPGFALEKTPHITILYGLHDHITKEDILPVFKTLVEPPKAYLKEVSCFETNPDFDVVKIDVSSTDFTMLNEMLRENYPYTNDFPDYKPHMTIGYVKKGKGRKYEKKLKKEYVLEATSFTYSYPDKTKEKFKLKDL